MRRALWAVALLALASCSRSDTIVALMVVTVEGSLSNVASLEVSVEGPPENLRPQTYSRPGQQSIVFPTTLTGQLPGSAAGTVTFKVIASAADGSVQARGAAPASLAAGTTATVYVPLSCSPAPCKPMTQQSEPDGGAAPEPGCGNGVIDQNETCDVAIAAGAPGACPRTCDTGIACAPYVASGKACTLTCKPTTPSGANDGCCPAGATPATDPDCSPTCGDGVVDPDETCDTAIPAGSPGACPTAADCVSSEPCVVARLVSESTCSAVCLRTVISQQFSGDGCCPAGVTNTLDTDCPAACGDGVRGPGETCDVGIPAPQPGSCPVTCDDGNPATLDQLHGAGCQAVCSNANITDPISGDGYCPPGQTHATDTDCPAACGDGIVERGETCDPQSPDGACPDACPPSPAACLQTALTGSGAACTAACVSTAITACGPADGCCPAGCTAASDPDCSSTCGDGHVQAGEACDTAITSGAGACPKSCDDGDPCTDDRLLSAGTCQAVCVHLPITLPAAGDGCCPSGATFLADADCAPACGNGVVEAPVEKCDPAVAGSCPTTCPTGGSCTTVTLRGSASNCSAACVATPIVTCVNRDGCCPAGCTAATDTDCPIICGDGVVETGETCDRAITAGLPGACAATCDDGDACTTDLASGSISNCTRTCLNAPITACLSGDGCCPPGCTAANDSDCAPLCNDGIIEAGETCDPPTTCPTTCPDDGDACTIERLVGDPAQCTSACQHVPITACSGSTRDGCCPSICTAATDSDC
ncbi:MAG TPA: hypothetical protein VMT03_20420 [Polyangia bacterium]|nr:hypothetical protein [Polyangia bacterium]